VALGEILALASALAWAVGVVLYRRLGETLPPLALNFLKNLLVLGFVLPTVPLLHGLAWPTLSSGELLTCLLSGVLGIALADTLYFRALNRLGASRAGVIGNFYSPFVIVLSYLFLAERLAPVQIAGFLLVSVGVFLVGRPERNGEGSGDLAAVLTGALAIFLMAAAIVMVKRILEAEPLLWIVLLRLLGGILGMLLIFAFTGFPRALGAARIRWSLLLPAAFVGQYLSMIFWLGGYKYTQASVAAILNESSSVFIVLLAWLLLGERLSTLTAVGVVLSLAGIACMLLA
jgi:drug/metabolite transporter (DMT)-like permease